MRNTASFSRELMIFFSFAKQISSVLGISDKIWSYFGQWFFLQPFKSETITVVTVYYKFFNTSQNSWKVYMISVCLCMPSNIFCALIYLFSCNFCMLFYVYFRLLSNKNEAYIVSSSITEALKIFHCIAVNREKLLALYFIEATLFHTFVIYINHWSTQQETCYKIGYL